MTETPQHNKRPASGAGAIRAMVDKLITWLLVGNGASLVLLYNAAANGGIEVNWGARVVAATFTMGMVCGFLGYYQVVRSFSVRQQKRRGEIESDVAQEKTDKITLAAARFFLASAVCFLVGVISPLFGLLTLKVSG